MSIIWTGPPAPSEPARELDFTDLQISQTGSYMGELLAPETLPEEQKIFGNYIHASLRLFFKNLGLGRYFVLDSRAGVKYYIDMKTQQAAPTAAPVPGDFDLTTDTDGGHGGVFGWNDPIVVVLQSGQRFPAVHSKDVRQGTSITRSDFTVLAGGTV